VFLRSGLLRGPRRASVAVDHGAGRVPRPVLDPGFRCAVRQGERDEGTSQVLDPELPAAYTRDEQLFPLSAGGTKMRAKLLCQLVVLERTPCAERWLRRCALARSSQRRSFRSLVQLLRGSAQLCLNLASRKANLLGAQLENGLA
jgi:hypothetical protein